MSLFSGLSGVFSNIVNLAVTAFTGNALLGQFASSVVNAALSESGSNAAFDSVFNQAFSEGFSSAMRA